MGNTRTSYGVDFIVGIHFMLLKTFKTNVRAYKTRNDKKMKEEKNKTDTENTKQGTGVPGVEDIATSTETLIENTENIATSSESVSTSTPSTPVKPVSSNPIPFGMLPIAVASMFGVEINRTKKYLIMVIVPLGSISGYNDYIFGV